MRRLIGEESGQSLIIVAISITVVLGIAAVAIDVGSWYVRHHQAQVVADSAALAAANCLANPGGSPGSVNGTAVPACTSNTDTTDAAIVAQDYAAANGVSINTGQVNISTAAKTVTVTPSATAPSFFANLVGLNSINVSTTAQASWTNSGVPACTATQQSNNQCYVAFASSPTSTVGVTDTANNTTINGAVHSNCSLANNGNNNTKFNGSSTYGNGTGCTLSQKSGNPAATQDTSQLCFPVDYSGLTANPSSCGGTDLSPGMTATSSYCTQTYSASATIPTSGGYLVPGVYCFTSGTATISGSAQSGAGITVIAPAFNLSGAGTLYPYTGSGLSGNQLVLYQYTAGWNGWTSTNAGCSGTSYSSTLTLSGNSSFNLNGYIFAPCSYVDYTANNTSMVGFIEAYSILFEGASMKGSGPAPSPTGAITTASGSDLLTG